MATISEIEGKTLFSLTDLLDTAAFPDFLLSLQQSVADLLDNIFFTDIIIQSIDGGVRCKLILALPQELAFSLVGMDSIKFILGGKNGISVFEADATFVFAGSSLSSFRVRLKQVPVSLRINAEILRPLKPGTDEPDLQAEALEVPLGAIDIEANGDGNLDFKLVGSPLKIPPCMVGNTGILLDIGSLSWLTPASPDLPTNVPHNFTGLFLDDVIVRIPQLSGSSYNLKMDDVFIGTGGFSGKVSFSDNGLAWDTTLTPEPRYTGKMVGKLFGFQAGLGSIEIEFKQNSLIKASLNGEIFLPFLDKRIGVDLTINPSDSMTVRLTSPIANQVPPVDPNDPLPHLNSEALLYIKKPGLVEAYLESISFEESSGSRYVRLCGKIHPLIAGIDWPEFYVRELAIDSSGKIKLEGGWLDLPETKKFDFYGFTIELSKLGFGTIEDTGERWIGLNGSINFPLPAGASVEGLRIIWDPKELGKSGYLPKLELNGVGVKMAVPGAFSFEGKVSFFEDSDRGSKGFKGDIRLQLDALGCTVDGKLIIGQSLSGYTFFYIYLSADLPAGIPLFNTGTAIYGFQALLAVNMEPNRKPEEQWYQGWYKRNPIGATDTSKWWDVQGSLAFGAGITLGTATDDGFSLNTKTLLILVLPGPVILLEGKGNFLKRRPATKDVTAEGAFTALLVLDGRQRIFQANLDARYSLVKVIDVHGGAEAFFDFDRPGDWHLFLGQKEPEDRRIQANILNLFNGNAYWMMWKDRLEAGAWIGYRGGPWSFGPLSAEVEAWMSGYGSVSRNPSHLEALIQLYGLLKLQAFGAGLDLNVDAVVQGRGPTPWEFDALFKGSLKINLLFTSLDLEAEVHLHYEEDLPASPVKPVLGMASEHLKTDESWEMPFVESISSTVPASLPAPSIIPPDARPIIAFSRPISDRVRIGQATLQDPLPEIVKPGKYEFSYRLDQIELLKRTSSDWVAISASAYISEFRAPDTVILSHELEKADSFKGGRLFFGNDVYEIVETRDNPSIKLKILSSGPSAGPCLLAAGTSSVTGQIAASDTKNNEDGSSTVTIPSSASDLPGDTNAFAGGTLVIANKKFVVLGNTKRQLSVLNIFENAQEIIPSAGSFELSAPTDANMYGQWLPTDQTNPNIKTKLQLWTRTPYTYFRRNSSYGSLPSPFDACGPDVSEEPICIKFDNIRNSSGTVVDSIKPNEEYHVDAINFEAENEKVSITTIDGHQAIYLDSKKGHPARIHFRFEPPLDMVKIDGLGDLSAEVGFTDGTVGYSSDVFALGSARFSADNIRKIQHLMFSGNPEEAGTITGICFLPGWTCTTISESIVSYSEGGINVGAIKLEGRNELVIALNKMLGYASGLEQTLRGIVGSQQLAQYQPHLNALNLEIPAIKKAVGDLLSSLQTYTREGLDQLQESVDNVVERLSKIRKDILVVPVSSTPTISTGGTTIGTIRNTPRISIGTTEPVTIATGTAASSSASAANRPDPIPEIIRILDEILQLPISLDVISHLTIHFPQPATRVRLGLRGRISTRLDVRAYGDAIEFAATTVMAQSGAVYSIMEVVSQREGWIDRVEITGLDPGVEEICYDSPEFAWSRKQQYTHRRKWQQQLEYWYKKDDVLRPATQYLLRMVTTITNEATGTKVSEAYWHGCFQTGLPPLGQDDPGATSYPAGGVLANLDAYVSRTVPADGAGEKGKHPVYRGYDVGVEFNENYIDRLYHLANMPLAIRILDNNGTPVAKMPNRWAEAPEKRFTEGERKWIAGLNLNNSTRCAQVNWSEVPSDSVLYGTAENTTLKPETLHRAELFCVDTDNKIYRPYSFEFTTSKFVNFTHHIHSFKERLWNVQAGSGATKDVLDQLFNDAFNEVNPKVQAVESSRSKLGNAKLRVDGSSPTEQDFKAYDDASKEVAEAWADLELKTSSWFNQVATILGVGSLSTAQNFEISTIKNASGNIQGLMLESPEPIDWHRTSIEILSSPEPILAYPATSPSLKLGSTLKITDTRLPDPRDPTPQYWIELLALQETDLDGYKIEVAEDPATSSTGLSYREYFTFAKGEKLEEGQRVLVGSKQGKIEPRVKWMNATATPLYVKITWIRLLDRDGQIIHQQVVQPDMNYRRVANVVDLSSTTGTSSILILPNTDGTRALLLWKGTGIIMPSTSYLFKFLFKRNIGPEAHVLREAGYNKPELASVRFYWKP